MLYLSTATGRSTVVYYFITLCCFFVFLEPSSTYTRIPEPPMFSTKPITQKQTHIPLSFPQNPHCYNGRRILKSIYDFLNLKSSTVIHIKELKFEK